MLRDHAIFKQPLNVDLSKTIEIPTPSAWDRELDEEEVSVLPLVADTERTYNDGWCVYTYEHVQAPELEIICGGINAKTPKASGIWRQGFLMHFGFEPSPDEMNENGKALLVNSICYIAQCRNDRPIVRTPSAFYSRVRKYDRGTIDRLIKNTARELDVYLNYYVDKETKNHVGDMDRQELAEWFKENRGYLRADDRGQYSVDEDAKRFGIAVDTPRFIDMAIDALNDSDRKTLAARLLARYIPLGPTDSDDVGVWRQWHEENREYLFFSDTGGCCWLIDLLAKANKIPTDQLRGSARHQLLTQPAETR